MTKEKYFKVLADYRQDLAGKIKASDWEDAHEKTSLSDDYFQDRKFRLDADLDIDVEELTPQEYKESTLPEIGVSNG